MELGELQELYEAAMYDLTAVQRRETVYRAIQVSEAEAAWLRAIRDAWPYVLEALEGEAWVD